MEFPQTFFGQILSMSRVLKEMLTFEFVLVTFSNIYNVLTPSFKSDLNVPEQEP